MDKDVSSVLKQAVAEVLEEVRRVPPQVTGNQASGNRIEIQVNAGGIGVWIAATACLVVLAVTIVSAIFTSHEFTRQGRELQELREQDEIHDAWIQTLNKQQKAQK